MKHLVIIGQVIPEPASTAAGIRMMQLIQIFEENNFKVTFLTDAANDEFSEDISLQKIQVNDSKFDIQIRELAPDIVVFDRFVTEEKFGWRVRENCPNALTILDTEDLHFLREARKRAFQKIGNCSELDLINDVFMREMASILRCDLTLIISEFEYKLLIEEFGISNQTLFYLPFLWDENPILNPGFIERNDFVSIGNFLHEPNWQTVLQLKEIWPRIRKKLTESELHIYGAYASDKVYQLNNLKEGFVIKGRAESSAEVFKKYRVLLAPIPYGAGLKGKLFESMKYGIPNVTSSIGAEAMHGELPWNGFIEDEHDFFVSKAIELFSAENTWSHAQQNGYEILKKVFFIDDFEKQFLKRIEEIQKDLQKHRKSNFLGLILQHHQLNSTKYLSKFIEEKNKKTTSEE